VVSLTDSVRYVTGVGPKLAERFHALGVETALDLLRYYPRRYLDRSAVSPINKVKLGEEVTVIGTVVKVDKKFSPRQHKKILTVDIADGAGYLSAVWFNNWWHADKMPVGTEVSFSGKVVFSYNKLQMTNPAYDILGVNEDEIGRLRDGEIGKKGIEEAWNTGRIIPLYPASGEITTNTIRRVVSNLLDSLPFLPDPLPENIIQSRSLLTLDKAVRQIHVPDNAESVRAARKRLIYDEFYLLELGLGFRKARLEGVRNGISHQTSGPQVNEFFAALPFALTKDQKQVIEEILLDLERPTPMHRLLQGEVGSGKTAVAVAAMVMAVNGGFQGAIMAPTEVLAEQHAIKISELLPEGVTLALLTGSTSASKRAETLENIKTGEIDIVVGTHAVIQEGVEFKKLGLAVIDEQHRFGVRQRLELKGKGNAPDVLVMTATPIPRTLALTLYGDLDVSVIHELPAGRREIETIVADQKHRAEAYKLIRQQIAMGRQAYVVCALVDESDKVELKAATAEAERLQKEIFPDLKVAVIHGQMKSSEKDGIMADLRQGKLDILIATTVIEVGIDIPNATVMLIENAERFGLSQLHQLRGRIGRGEHKSFCILFADPSTEDAKERMKAIADTTDGFELAEADLRIRGEGQIFGARQSGLPDFHIASVIRDLPVLLEARDDAFSLVKSDSDLARHPELLEEVKNRFGDKFDWLTSG
jgi:ATP-dependent DNA helicase RecG